MGIDEVKSFIVSASPNIHYDDLGGDAKANKKKFIDLIKKHGIVNGLEKAKEVGVPINIKPVSSHKMTFDSQQAQLEPIYYWLLDFIRDAGWDVEKITDNFMSSPGSGHFGEMGQRASLMQDRGMKLLVDINQVVKSVLNLIYDLKEFEIRLEHYDDARSDDKEKKEAGDLALKQIWLDNVDMKKGRGAIHQMAVELGYTTIREAFMIANNVDDLKKMNKYEGGGLINDQVLRILIPRMSEYLLWVDYSEKELRKRMSIERNYLKSQVETIKLYSSWMKPYLKAAEDLRQRGFSGDAALVNAFSTTMFELNLLGTKSEKVPEQFGEYNLKRKYHPLILVGMKYRGRVSQRVTQGGDQHFAMGGRVDMTFDAFALNSDELKLVKKAMEEKDVSDSMNYKGDVAAEALMELREDIEHFLSGDKDVEKAEEKKKSEDINPFKALFSIFKFERKSKKKNKVIEGIGDISPDNFVEKVVRANAEKTAGGWLYTVYDIYKKAHGMASAPGEGFDLSNEEMAKEPSVKLSDIFKGQDRT
ncbi:MAG: hypothetical protein ABIF88_04105 [archaeon]